MSQKVNLFFCVIIFFLAAIITFSLYPGWLFGDSWYRWRFAQAILNYGLFADFQSLGFSTQFPVFSVLIYSLFYKVTGEYGFYAWVQSVLLFFSLWLFLTKYLKEFSKIFICAATLIVILIPVIWTYAVLHAVDTLAGILLIYISCMLISLSNDNSNPKVDIAILVSLCLFISAIRFNGFSIFPIIFIAFNKININKIKKYILSLLFSLICISMFFHNELFKLAYFDVSRDGFLLRSWRLSSEIDNEDLKASLKIHLKDPNKLFADDCYNWAWCADFSKNLTYVNDKYYDKMLKKAYIHAVISNPIKSFVALKGFLWSQLGVSKPLFAEISGRDTPSLDEKFKMIFDNRRVLLLSIYHKIIYKLDFLFLRPWLLLLLYPLLTFLLFIITKDKNKLAINVNIWLLGLFYFVPFVLISPNHEFRYYFPTFIVWFLGTYSAVLELVFAMYKRMKFVNVH
jgi:hypothetical protein